jgi:hypothetical protein
MVVAVSSRIGKGERHMSHTAPAPAARHPIPDR